MSLARIFAMCAACGSRAAAQVAPTFALVPIGSGPPADCTPASHPGHPRSCATSAGSFGSTSSFQLAGALAVLAGVSRSLSKRRHATALHGVKDRVKKDFSTKSAMIKKLGKLVLMREFDMRKQIMEDPKLAKRSGVTQEQLLADFERAGAFLRTELGCKPLEADICISKVATGLHMQHLGRPAIPQTEEMLVVLDWLMKNLEVKKEDGSLRTVVEKYPFVLGRTVEQLDESRRFCPPDIDYNVAVAEDPALVDKTYNCDGICASMCMACWYNG